MAVYNRHLNNHGRAPLKPANDTPGTFCEHGSGGAEGGDACRQCLARHVQAAFRAEQFRDGGRVVRTVYVPNESVETLTKVINTLRTQLAEQVTTTLSLYLSLSL